ncbi:MAG: amidohydrolase family protein [Pseudomonadota bacterium]
MIDAHHHIWLQKDLPWLLGPEQPRIFGPYAAIKRDYTIDEFRADVQGTGIDKSVYVQANWAPNWFADEAAWVQSVADETGWPNAIVGYADCTVDDVRSQLEKLKPYPLMRGIRQQLHWHENPLYRFASRPDLPADKTVQANIARLADYGWSFDLQVFAPQMGDAVRLARACPDVTFILQHAGMLEDTSDDGVAAWRDGMNRLADCPNVVTKLSAFGTFIHRNDPDFIAQMVDDTVGIFGADRCLYGSNFPIEKIWTSYRALFDAFRSATQGFSEDDRDAIFRGNAARVYRI